MVDPVLITVGAAVIGAGLNTLRGYLHRQDETFSARKFAGALIISTFAAIAIGQTIAALEATPKIWDIAAAWLILEELHCLIKWLETNPKDIVSGTDLTSVNFPLLTASSEDQLNNMLPWAKALIEDT